MAAEGSRELGIDPASPPADGVAWQRALADLASEGLAIHDGGVIRYANRALADLVGLPVEEVVGRRVLDFVAPASLEAVRAHIADELSGSYRMDVLRADGSIVPAEASGRWVEIDGVRYRAARVRDVSASVAAEETLRTLFDENPVPVWVWDVDTFRFLDVNRACEELYGYTREEFLGMTALDIRPPDEVPRLQEAAASGGPDVRNFGVWKHRRKDGGLLDVEVHSSLIEFQGHRARISLAIDVTGTLGAERRLREAEERYRTLVETIPAIVYLDQLGELSSTMYMSPQTVAILGFTPSQFYADPNLWERLLHPDDHDRVVAAANEQNATLEPYELEYRMLARDGRVVWIHDEGSVVRDDLGTPLYWQGFWVDVTDRHRAEEERRGFLARLVAAQEEERYRIAGDVHDDPVQAMTTVALRLAIVRAGLEDPEIVDEFDKLEASVNRAVDRLRHLLFELHPRTLDVDGLVPAIREYVARWADEEEGIGFRIVDRLAEEPSSERRLILYRIAQEALTNVRKHAGATQVVVTIDARDGGVLLRVEDDGVGLRESEPRSARPGHLGLAAMRERAELAGGWCRIDAREGGGVVVESFVPGDRDGDGHDRDASPPT